MSFGNSYQQPPYFQDSSTPAQKPQGSKWWLWAMAAIIGVSVVGFALCCGGGVWLMSFSMDVITAEVEDQLRDNPRVQEHIGEIQEFKMDWSRSFAADDDETFVYRIKGNKGAGKVTVKHVSNDEGKEEVVSATLRLDSGTTVELVP